MRFFGPSKMGNALIVVGLLLLLYIPVSYGLTEVQGMLLRARLRAEHPSSAVVSTADWPEATETPAAATPTPAGQYSGAGTQTGSEQLSTPDQLPATSTPLPDTPAPTITGTPPPITLKPTGTPPPATLVPKGTLPPATLKPAVPLPTKTPLPPPPTPKPTLPPTATAPPPTGALAPLGPPARVVIPDLQIDTAVTDMGWTTVEKSDGSILAEWKVPDNTAGWAVTSAELGVPGNIVLSAHNNLFAMVFRNISLAWPENAKRQLNPATYSSDILNGRSIELYAADGTRFEYQITGFYRLHDSGVPVEQREENASYMQPTQDPELTLITCWPPWSNTYRVVLRAKLVQ